MDSRIELLEKQVETLSGKLVNNFLQTIDLLSSLIETEERYYEGSHCRFLAEKSDDVARYLNLGEAECFSIKTAALLHDIGKIGLPDRILMKSVAEMNSEEFDFYARHPELGKQLLLRHDNFETIAKIVHQHHERLDGSGFPQHLRGDAIHIGAQIIQVVDTYHNAMHKINKDRYQNQGANGLMSYSSKHLDLKRVRYNQTMNFLNQKAGILYNKKVVEAFVTVMEIGRRKLGEKTIRRYSVNQLKPGMSLVEDYYTSYGLLVAAKNETITARMIEAMIKFAEIGEIPQKVLVVD